jgi:hypothetical protein
LLNFYSFSFNIMSKGFFSYLLVLVTLAVCFQGCTPDDLDTTDPDRFNQVVCDGGGSNTYLPLALGNTWKYKSDKVMDPLVRRVEGTVPYDSNTYFIVMDEYTSDDITMFLRQDSTGNIVQYRSGTEFVYIPADPEVGDWWINTGDTLSVTAVSSSYSTEYCDYRNVLIIQQRNQSGILENTRYYVKGIGEVYNTIAADTSNLTLYDISLQ